MAYPEYMDYKFAIKRGLADHTVTVVPAFCSTISGTASLIREDNSYGMTTPAAVQYMRLTSSDAGDATAGTGARSVFIEGVAASGTQLSETLAPDGTTPETTANQYLRVNRMSVNSVGSGGKNAGVMYLSENAGSTAAGVPKATTSVFAIIPAGDSVNKDGKYYVPATYTCYVNRIGMGGNGSAVVYQASLYEQGSDGIRKKTYTTHYGPGYRDVTFSAPLRFAPLTDIWVEVSGAASATAANVDMELIFIKGD